MTIEKFISDPQIKEKFVLQKLICYFLDISKEELWSDTNREISQETSSQIILAYHSIVDQKKPLEYVLGFVEFFGIKFYVNENTLIPRPETEYMIQAMTEYCSAIGDQTDNVLLDIGTGSGVLGISILLQNSGFFEKVIFSDISSQALQVAEQNYDILIKDHHLKPEFIEGDLLDFLSSPSFSIFHSNIFLVANLPYIPEQTFEENVSDNVKKREPKMAFVGGDDGLIYYRKMFDQIIHLGLSHCKSFCMFLEMMTWQLDILQSEYSDTIKFEVVKTFHFNIIIVKGQLIRSKN